MLFLVRATLVDMERIRAANAGSPTFSLAMTVRSHRGEAQIHALNDLSKALLEQVGLGFQQWYVPDDYANVGPLVLANEAQELPAGSDPTETYVPLTPEHERRILAGCRLRTPMDRMLAWVLAATDTPAALPGLGRKLPHYRKYGYLVFEGEEPVNVAKGEWRVADSPLAVLLGGARYDAPGTAPDPAAVRAAVSDACAAIAPSSPELVTCESARS
jgi:hypothetical protein